MNKIRLNLIINNIIEEFIDASTSHSQMKSKHEGIAIIEEEFLELRDAIYNKHHTVDQVNREAVQLGAMAIRFLYDLGGNK